MDSVKFGLLLAVLFTACSNPVATIRPPELVSEEQLLQVHKKLALDEQIEIDAFIRRSGLKDIRKTESGLYISARNAESKIRHGDTIKMFVNIMLVNGDEIFEGQRDVIIGRSEMIQGLREALPLMSYGDRAFLIIPSHLAYGFSGDGEAIPARATLLYDLIINKK